MGIKSIEEFDNMLDKKLQDDIAKSKLRREKAKKRREQINERIRLAEERQAKLKEGLDREFMDESFNRELKQLLEDKEFRIARRKQYMKAYYNKHIDQYRKRALKYLHNKNKLKDNDGSQDS